MGSIVIGPRGSPCLAARRPATSAAKDELPLVRAVDGDLPLIPVAEAIQGEPQRGLDRVGVDRPVLRDDVIAGNVVRARVPGGEAEEAERGLVAEDQFVPAAD